MCARDLLREWIAENPSGELQNLLTAAVLQTYNSLATFDLDLGEVAAIKAISFGEQCSIGYLSAWAYAVAGLIQVQRANLNGAAGYYSKGLTQK